MLLLSLELVYHLEFNTCNPGATGRVILEFFLWCIHAGYVHVAKNLVFNNSSCCVSTARLRSQDPLVRSLVYDGELHNYMIFMCVTNW